MTDNELVYANSIIDDANKVLLDIPGVVGVGITHSNVTGIGNEYQILVYIKDESVISLLPDNVYGMRVVYSVVGNVEIQAYVEVSEEYEKFLSNNNIYGNLRHHNEYIGQKHIQSMQREKYRPVKGGVSGGLFSTVKSTGTIGCIAKEAGGSGRTVLVSNNHVFIFDIGTIQFKGVKGDPIIQPGLEDGGTIDDKVATVEKWIPVKSTGNTIDAAYAIPTVDTKTPGLCELYAGSSVDPIIGMAVSKGGRTTGCTNGNIESIKITTNVTYTINSASQGEIKFVGQFTDCIAITGDGPVSQVGDSGSIWVTTSGNNVVGLNFAGTSSGSAIACKAKNVESILGVIFGDGSPGPGPVECNTPIVDLKIGGNGGGGDGGGEPFERYGCDPTGCVKDPNGPYLSLETCQMVCGKTKYTCKQAGSVKYCSYDPDGQYFDYDSCRDNCK